jgi:hypothetical protein
MMNRTRLFVLGPLVLATVALAQVAGVQGAKGEGAALSEDGRHAQFRFDVKKVHFQNGTSEVGGPLRFESESPATSSQGARHVVIEMDRAHVFAKRENVAEFGGPATIVVQTRLETIRRRGRLNVWVQDNRRPTDPNTDRPDVVRIQFFTENSTGPFYTFAGRVGRGDIQVYERRDK